jgi:hypothetical protein
MRGTFDCQLGLDLVKEVSLTLQKTARPSRNPRHHVQVPCLSSDSAPNRTEARPEPPATEVLLPRPVVCHDSLPLSLSLSPREPRRLGCRCSYHPRHHGLHGNTAALPSAAGAPAPRRDPNWLTTCALGPRRPKRPSSTPAPSPNRMSAPSVRWA